MPSGSDHRIAGKPDADVQGLTALSPDPVVVIQDGRHVFANPRALSLYGAECLEQLSGKPAIEYIDPSMLTQAAERMRSMTENGLALDYVDETILRLDGTRCEVEAAGSPIIYRGRPAALVVMRDTTRRSTAEAGRRNAEERFRSAFIHAPIGMAIVDETGVVREANPAMAGLLGVGHDDLLGRHVWHWLAPEYHRESRSRFARLLAQESTFETSQVQLLRPDGATRWVQVATSAICDHTGKPTSFVVQLQDLTDWKVAEALLVEQASHDQLTGLVNRSVFKDRLEQALVSSCRSGRSPAVLFMDLDRFKIVNDSMGHAHGDELLIEVADRFRRALRPGDTLARLGGDEFAVLIEDVHAVNEAARVANRLRESLHAPVLLQRSEVFVTVSIGISLAEPDSDAETLLCDADVAMYAAKASGGDTQVAFDDRMRATCSQRLDIEIGLRRALCCDELFLLYQPLIETGTGALVGVEALLRWKPAGADLVMPMDFIHVAEESGLIVPIGTWVLHEACRQLQRWRASCPDDPPLCMAVNVSSRQLGTPDLLDAAHELVPLLGRDHLCLEITETASTQLADAALDTLEQLRALGITIAIDDFGSGYSSLARLRQLPVDVLKIDREFINNVTTCSSDQSLVRAIVAMARALGLTVIAEGVETEQQAELLRAMNCHLAQGYFYGRPQAADLIKPRGTGRRVPLSRRPWTDRALPARSSSNQG